MVIKLQTCWTELVIKKRIRKGRDPFSEIAPLERSGDREKGLPKSGC